MNTDDEPSVLANFQPGSSPCGCTWDWKRHVLCAEHWVKFLEMLGDEDEATSE